MAGHAVLFQDRLDVLLELDARRLLQHHARRPVRPLLDPGLDHLDLALFQQAFLLRRHRRIFLGSQQQRRVDGALLQIAGSQARAIFIALLHVLQRVHAEVTLVLLFTMAMRASPFEQRLDLRIEINLLRSAEKRGSKG